MPYQRYGNPGFGGNPFRPGAIQPGVRGILIACAIVFLLERSLGDWFIRFFSFSVGKAVFTGCIWQFVSYMFLHDPNNLFHILLNLFMVWMFGRRLEMRWGSREFLRFYIFCGIGAAVFHAVMLPFVGGDALMLGASGALYALLMAYAMYWGDDIVYLQFIIPMKVKYMVLLMGGLEFFSALSQASHGAPSGIAHFTHLGGLITAWLYLRNDGFRGLMSRFGGGKRASRPKQVRAPKRPYFDDDTWS